MNTDSDDGKSDDNSSNAFNFGTMLGEAMVAGKLFADDDKKTRNGVSKTMEGIRSDSKGTGNESDDDIENTKKEVSSNKKVASFFNGLTAGGF